jgi:uncharacterized protein (TIGR00251 family)
VASVTIPVRVQPRSRRDELVAVREGVLLIRVTAPPVDDRANDAVRRLLAKRLGIRASGVTIVRGERSRDKLVRIDDVDEAAARLALGV